MSCEKVAIKHGKTENQMYGPYVVVALKNGRMIGSVSNIRTAEDCQDHADEYQRFYGGEIVTPNLLNPDEQLRRALYA